LLPLLVVVVVPLPSRLCSLVWLRTLCARTVDWPTRTSCSRTTAAMLTVAF
jgi:hypothetical protein